MFEEEAHLSKEPIGMYHVSRTVEDACPYGFDQDMSLCAMGAMVLQKSNV